MIVNIFFSLVSLICGIAYLLHKAHHKKMGKEDSECFGLLNVPKKFFIQNTKK